MPSLIRSTLFAAVVWAVPLGAALAQPPYPPVPPPRYEAVPPPPGASYIWEPGHWHWNGVQYIWLPGHYVVRHARYRRYIPGIWVMRGGTWVWVPAHWG